MAERGLRMAESAIVEWDELDIRLMLQYGLAIDSNARHEDEDPQQFQARVVREAPEIILKAEGSPEIAALVFGVEPELWTQLKAEHPEIREAFIEGTATGRARKYKTVQGHDTVTTQVVDDYFRKALEEAGRPVPDEIPQDPAERRKYLIGRISDHMRTCAGDEYELAAVIGVTADEILSVIESSEVLKLSRQEQADASLGLILGSLRRAAEEGTYTAKVKYLEKKFPERFGPRADVSLKGGAYTSAPAEEKSALDAFTKTTAGDNKESEE